MEARRKPHSRKGTHRWSILLAVLILAGGMWGLTGEIVSVEAARKPRATQTSTPTRTATSVPTATAVWTATPPATGTSTPVSPATPTGTSTAAPTSTPTPTRTSTPPASPGLALTVYGDVLAAGWSNWSWNSDVSFTATSPVYSGTRTMAFSVTAGWGALYLHTDAGVETSPYNSIRFAAQASQSGQRYGVLLYGADNQQLTSSPLLLADYGGDPIVGAWKIYSLPLASLNGTNSLIRGLAIQGQNGTGQPVVYVDELGFGGSGAPVPSPSPTATSAPLPPSAFRRGVNLAGAEFGESKLPGTYGVDYIYPNETELDYYKGKGLTLIRLPFRWERLQRSLHADLDPTELGRMDQFIAAARTRGMKVILDPHNYARYNGQLIGSAAVPSTAFRDFWRKVAAHYKDESAIWAYALVNEPHDTGGLWPAAAQAGVDGIRSVDMTHVILVPGDQWSGAWSWQQYNANLSVSDPANNLLYEAHQYFDGDHSGRYAQSYDAQGAYPTIGIDRVKPFVDWLQARGVGGFIGEYGIPDNDSRWLTVLDNFLAYLDANSLSGAYWAGGPWWDGYALSVEPRNGQDRPQMSVLVKHLGSVR